MNRSNTTEQTRFVLAGPDAVTFNFSERDHIRITVPPHSTWRTKYHWHSEQLGCMSIECLEGRVKGSAVIYDKGSYGFGGTAGTSQRFRPGGHITWSPDGSKDDEFSAMLTVSNENLYRNILSATLDAERYPYLSTTPYWVRLLYRVFSRSDAARKRLTAVILWIQIQATQYEYAYWEYHGQINVTGLLNRLFPWSFKKPPRWAVNLQTRSQDAFSLAVQASCYRLGGLFLGLKGKYPEYTL